jgi:hypothetical protein
MKYITFSIVSLAMFTWLACGHGRPVNESGTTETTQAVTPANTTLQPQTIPVNLNSQTSPASVTPATISAPGMNPAHGQPGHRCDIGVGEPLNSKPTSPSITPQPAAVNTPVSPPINISSDKPASPAATTAVAPGMNPAHGEPGHRCDIAVGSPLNSKPAQQPAINSPTPLNISSEPAVKTDAPTKVAPGMNPAHGQPGHRCEIAVGAPLDSKPVVVEGVPSKNTVSGSQTIPSVVPVKPTQDPKKNNR